MSHHVICIIPLTGHFVWSLLHNDTEIYISLIPSLTNLIKIALSRRSSTLQRKRVLYVRVKDPCHLIPLLTQGPCWLGSKESPATQETLGQEDVLEEEMATHSGILAWEVPRTEEPGRQQSSGRRKVDMALRKFWSPNQICELLRCFDKRKVIFVHAVLF